MLRSAPSVNTVKLFTRMEWNDCNGWNGTTAMDGMERNRMQCGNEVYISIDKIVIISNKRYYF